ncbi:YkvA family protein [Streptomyces sp. NPDC047046]|uniref:YkvA family protein n=1 Tax=Streptomyces sp. NPDC047046 TaxID=3155378 RepID=UPI0033E6CBC6
MSDDTRDLLIVLALLAVAVLAIALVLAVRLVRTRRTLRAAGLPAGKRWVFWGALLYLVLPTDLVPDPVYLDDIGVLLLALRSLRAGETGAAVRHVAGRATRGRAGGGAARLTDGTGKEVGPAPGTGYPPRRGR